MKLALLLLLLPGVLLADEVYFSPRGHVKDQIVKRIESAHASIDIAMYSLTSEPIAQALAVARRRGIRVRVVRDLSQSSDKGDEDTLLEQNQIEVHILRGIGRGIMHDKFAIFDGREGFTGSYNWTNNAEYDNYENAYFFTDPALLQAYEKEFERLWQTPQSGEAHHRIAGGAPSLFQQHPLLSLLGLFLILLALAAALAT